MAGAAFTNATILQHYQHILEAAGVVIFTADKNGVLTYISPSAHTLTGYQIEALIGKSIADLASADWQEHIRQHYKGAGQQTQSASKLEFPIQTTSGDHCWIEQTIFIVNSDSDKQKSYYQGIILDISKRKATESKLQENEQRFRGLFDHSNDAVFFINLDGTIANVNQRASTLFGYHTDELIGRQLQDTIAPSESDAGNTIHQRLLSGEHIDIYESTCIHKNGTTIPVSINTTLVYDAAGQPSHIQRIMRDISDRKRTQSQLADRIHQLTTLREVDAELADRLDVDYVLTMAVDSAVRLTGADIGFIARIDEEHALQQAKIVGPYSLEAVEEYYGQQAGIVGRVIRNMKAELVPDVHQDADYVAVNPQSLAQLTVPLISQERLIGILSLETSKPERFNHDTFELVKLVTARIAAAIDNAYLYKQSESQLEQLRDLYARVSRLEQLKTDMIRIASHDLRNPLASLSGFIELMQMDLPEVPTAEQLEDQLKNMAQSTNRMNKIIRDILSLERIEQAVNEDDYQIFSIAGLVEQIIDEHQPQAKMQQQVITLVIDEDPDEPLLVKGQEAEIREAAANLITNALKYTPKGGKINISLAAEHSRIVFTVQDNGYGIKKEQQENLFQPFYRAKTIETAGIEGTGLGLHLVKKVIERHHGKMFFESVYGQGSTFGFTLPWAMS